MVFDLTPPPKIGDVFVEDSDGPDGPWEFVGWVRLTASSRMMCDVLPTRRYWRWNTVGRDRIVTPSDIDLLKSVGISPS